MNRFSADHTYTLNILRFCFACSRVTGSLLGWWKAGAKEHTVIVNEVENMWLVCWRFCAKRNKQHAIFTWKKKKKVKLNWIELNLYSRFARLLSQLVSECIQTNCTLAVGWFSHIFNVSELNDRLDEKPENTEKSEPNANCLSSFSLLNVWIHEFRRGPAPF